MNALNVDYYTLIDDSPGYQIDDQPFFTYLERMTFYYNLLNDTSTKDKGIVNKVKSLEAINKCELCGKDAPFKDKSGTPYLEFHYVVWLSEGGDPTPSNTVVLCPNCHRRIHVLRDPEDKEKLLKILSLRNR